VSLELIDEALERYRERTIIPADEAINTLLDLRSSLRSYSDDTKEGWLNYMADHPELYDDYSEALAMQREAMGPEPARPEC
jgi:hypothetical protein